MKYVHSANTIERLVGRALIIPTIAIMLIFFIVAGIFNYYNLNNERLSNINREHQLISNLIAPSLSISDMENVRRLLNFSSEKGQILAAIDNKGDLLSPDYLQINFIQYLFNQTNKKFECDSFLNKKISLNSESYIVHCTAILNHDSPLLSKSPKKIGYLISFSPFSLFPISITLIALIILMIILGLFLLAKWIHVNLEKVLIKPFANLKEQIDCKILLSKQDFLSLGELKNSPKELLEIKEVFEKLLKKAQRINDIERNAALGEMSAQVAHDIRSPLAALNAIVKQTQNIPEKQRIMIRNATKQINDIANNLLVQYRTEKSGEPAANQNTASSEMISILLDTVISEKRAQEHAVLVNIEFTVDPDSHGVFAKVNPADFKRVISNLINNGIEALKSGGNIILNLSHTNNLIKIDLTDSGSGMPQELIHQIMTGAAVTRKKEGHGIGLASSRQYIQSWGGDLTISSEINVGTTIHITLPLIPPADWFADKLEFTQNSSVIILDDDQSIHDVWQSRIDTEIPNTNLTLNHFYQPQDLLKSQIKADKYLCDYELLGHALSGLDVIEQLGLSNNATLVTSRYEDPVIQERCRKIGVKILPKNYAAYVPLVITTPFTNELKTNTEEKSELNSKPKPDLILIDDNQTLTDAWKFSAEFENKNIVVFNSLKEVDDNIYQYSVESKIYIDSDLGEAIRGEDYAKILYEKGFQDIYLATGYDSSKFDLNKFYWIKNIVSKEPAFD